MKALTIRQPHASLIVLGPKRIETRSWATKYRGPLLLHAGLARPEAFDAEDGPVGEIYGPEEEPLLWQWYPESAENGGGWTLADVREVENVQTHPLPLGAIIGSCNLVDVVPIGGPTDFSSGLVEGEEPPTAGVNVIVNHGASLILDRWQGSTDDITDQLPYGDFHPGRRAWLLEDAKPTTERCPACWGEGEIRRGVGTIRQIPGWASFAVYPKCDTCNGKGTCDPIPAKGRQGLWEVRL